MSREEDLVRAKKAMAKVRGAMRKTDNAADRERERREAQADADREARRDEEQAAAEAGPASAGGAMPAPRQSMVFHTPQAKRECALDTCALPVKDPEDELCPRCRNRVNRESQAQREQQAVAARYEVPDEQFASASPAPF